MSFYQLGFKAVDETEAKDDDEDEDEAKTKAEAEAVYEAVCCYLFSLLGIE